VPGQVVEHALKAPEPGGERVGLPGQSRVQLPARGPQLVTGPHGVVGPHGQRRVGQLVPEPELPGGLERRAAVPVGPRRGGVLLDPGGVEPQQPEDEQDGERRPERHEPLRPSGHGPRPRPSEHPPVHDDRHPPGDDQELEPERGRGGDEQEQQHDRAQGRGDGEPFPPEQDVTDPEERRVAERDRERIGGRRRLGDAGAVGGGGVGVVERRAWVADPEGPLVLGEGRRRRRPGQVGNGELLGVGVLLGGHVRLGRWDGLGRCRGGLGHGWGDGEWGCRHGSGCRGGLRHGFGCRRGCHRGWWLGGRGGLRRWPGFGLGGRRCVGVCGGLGRRRGRRARMGGPSRRVRTGGGHVGGRFRGQHGLRGRGRRRGGDRLRLLRAVHRWFLPRKLAGAERIIPPGAGEGSRNDPVFRDHVRFMPSPVWTVEGRSRHGNDGETKTAGR
jgi:hypothetical protein